MEANDSTEMVGGREDSSGGVWGREGTAVIHVMRESVTVMVARVCEACEGKRSTMETCPERESPQHIQRQLDESQSTGRPIEPQVSYTEERLINNYTQKKDSCVKSL